MILITLIIPITPIILTKMTTYKLLWVDDEIELLKAHILFLEKKGYQVETVTNGYDALDRCAEEAFDLILLDENMPGLSGLETLTRVKELLPATPVVMVTDPAQVCCA